MVGIKAGAADCVLHNGKVLTVDAQDSILEAVAIQGKRIVAVGKDSEVLPLAGPGARTIDLRGRTVIPGIVDIHAHMDREGLKTIYPSLEGLRSIGEIKERIRGWRRTRRPGNGW